MHEEPRISIVVVRALVSSLAFMRVCLCILKWRVSFVPELLATWLRSSWHLAPTIGSAVRYRPVCRFRVWKHFCAVITAGKSALLFSPCSRLPHLLSPLCLQYWIILDLGRVCLGLRTYLERAGEPGVVRIGSGAHRSEQLRGSEALRGDDPFSSTSTSCS